VSPAGTQWQLLVDQCERRGCPQLESDRGYGQPWPEMLAAGASWGVSAALYNFLKRGCGEMGVGLFS